MENLYQNKHSKAIPVIVRALLFMLLSIAIILPSRAANPTITSFTPTSACSPNLSTTTVTITGNHFNGSTVVKFNGLAAASFTIVSNTSITAIPAAGTTTGVITITNASGNGSSVANFTVNAIPIVTVNSPSMCAGGSATLNATAGYTSYVWSTTATTPSITVSPASSTIYNVTVTNASGCTAAAGGIVTVNTASAITPYLNVNGLGWNSTSTATLCAGGNVEYGPQPIGGTWSWSGPGGFVSYARDSIISNLLLANSGTYIATYVGANGCSNTQNFTITVNANPTASISPTGPSTFCGPGVLTASGGGTYQWNAAASGASTAGITVSAGNTYAVTVTDGFGCTASASNAVTIGSAPAAPTSVTATPGTICSGATSQLSAISTGNIIKWWTAATGGTLLGTSASGANFSTGSLSTTTTYYAADSSAVGCASIRTAVTVTVNNVPSAVTVATAGTYCGSTTLTASGGTAGTMYWENTTNGGTSTATPSSSQTVTTSGTYYFSANNTCGWTQGSAAVTINALPAVAAIGGASTVCVGSTTTLSDATLLGTWSASNGSATVSILGVVTGVSAGIDTIYYTTAPAVITGCTNTTFKIITINPIPSAAITPAGPSSFCGSGILTALGGNTYVWSNAKTTAADTVTTSATYTVTVTTTATGCTASVSNNVTVNPIPAVPTAVTATPTTICNGQTSNLKATTPASNIRWWTAATGGTLLGTSTTMVNYPVTPSTTTTYYAEAYTATGCASATRVAVTVTVNPVPTAVTVSGGTTQCGGTVTLTASGGTGGTIYWENITSGGTSTATPSTSQPVSASGTYYFNAATGSCWGTQGSAIVTINPVPSAPTSVTATAASICVGQTSQLNATSAGNTIKWWTAATGGTLLGASVSGANFAVTPAVTTTYYASDSTPAGCASVTRTAVTDTVHALPVVGAITGTVSLCANATTTLSDTTAGGTWSSATPTIATISATGVVTGVSAGTSVISYTVSNAFGCTKTVTTTVTVKAIPALTTNNAISCSGVSVILRTIAGATTYHWTTGATVDSIITSTAGIYTVSVTNAAGCTASVNDTIISSTPVITVTNPATCAGGVDTLTASGAGSGASYHWSTGAGTASITTTTAGVYNVTVTNSSGCSATGTGVATVNPLPTPTVANDTICSGAIATLTANSGAVYVWSNGAHTISMTTATAGTYTVTVTNSGSCTATASGAVVIVANPTVTATNGVICSGAPTSITASGAANYVWSTGDATPTINISAIGTYTVTGTSSTGCTATASSSVSAVANPTASSTSVNVCAGGSATLTASGGSNYNWNTGASTNSITINPAITTTTYTVTVSNSSGCSATANGTVTVNPLPIAAATNGAICSLTPATITASGGTSYHWSTGDTTASISAIVATTYTVTVTNGATGCSATASSTVVTSVKPTVSVANTSACKGTAATLTANVTLGGPCTYAWSNGATTASISVTPAVSTLYTVTATNAAGCSASVNGTVTVYNVPAITASSNSPILLGSSINLTSIVTGGTATYNYIWNGPAAFTSASANPTYSSATVLNAGTYNVTVTDAHGCTASTSTIVILNYTSPGGIPSNNALWLNANIGVTTSAGSVTAWNDQSGLGNNATTVNATSPTFVTNSINSYPVVNFTTGGLQGPFNTPITSSAVSSFVVTQASTTSGNPSGIFSVSSNGVSDQGTNVGAVLFERSGTAIISYRNSGTRGNYTNANALGQYHLETSIFSSTSNINNFYSEGGTATNAAFTSSALKDSLYTVGSRYSSSPGSYLKGQIAELILFNTELSISQKNQVESYLATKYGFTLSQTAATNYVASNGTVFWNAATNGSFKNNIFGVGIDNVSTLNQTQSVSINTSSLSINSATGLGYYSFLMVSDSGGANALVSRTNLPDTINAVISNTWRATQTGGRAIANYVFNSSSTNFGYYAPISSSMQVYMLIDSNADGVYETYLSPVSTSGTNNTFNASLKDGTRFTFGFKAYIDYGDAPGVPTLVANNGAGHMLVPGVYLGTKIDAELDGQPSYNSVGDDTIGLADEDGVNFNVGVATSVNIVTMGSNSIIVTASVAGYLNAWIDLNQDNTYGGGSEYAIQKVHLAAGVNNVIFNVSDSVLYGPTSMRFRFATGINDVTAPTGLATNGEVEDYKVYVTAPLVSPCNNGFQNSSFELGPDIGANNYIITSESNLPYWRTTAADQDIEQWGTNFNGVPAYSGSYFMELEANLFGALYQDVYTTPGTTLQWSFAHRGRAGSDTCTLNIGSPTNFPPVGTFIDGTSAWGLHQGTYVVPAGQYITRIAFWAVGSYGGNQSIGNFLDQVSVTSSFDYGDAPDSYGTYLTSSGPRHGITSTLYLGTGVTCDADGQPSVAANIDSLDDGVTFPAPCNGCNTYTVSVKAYNNSGSPATIAGWIDFNKNGVFDNNERTSITIPSSASAQTVAMTFNVTAFSTTSIGTYGRFRIANDSTQVATPYGFAGTGEVEDYKIPCVALPLPIPSVTSPVCARGPLNLLASDSAYSNIWTGPNGFTSYNKDTTIASVPQADSGLFTIYAVYANGCVTDSTININVSNCYMNIAGNIFDDANGNGIIDGTDATTDLGQVVYAVLSSSTNTVLQTSLVAANGAFSFPNAPAYTTGMTIITRITNPAVGGSSGGSQWPPNWVGTKEQYGTNNLAGSGVDATPNLLLVTSSLKNITGALLGFDQLPITTPKTYLIPYPSINSQKSLTPANGLGVLGGSDPEDGSFASGNTFTITSLAGMNGNTLYYDANGDGILQSYEQIVGFTTITNFDPSKLYVKFVGAGSISATFNYGTTDAAGKVDPAPAPYIIKWLGTLPVKMLYFTAEKSGETQSLLKWATASEIDNDHFEIERSADAGTWEKIGQVKGAGNTEIETDYSMTDAEPLKGINYYRLKQVDVDGNFTYSEIAQVLFDASSTSAENPSTLSVYPNPLNQASKLNIALTSETENINEISIVNEIGQLVYSTTLPQIQNYQILGLNLPAGVYIVTVHTQTNNLLTSRLVIAR
jgi:hypothetical protein